MYLLLRTFGIEGKDGFFFFFSASFILSLLIHFVFSLFPYSILSFFLFFFFEIFTPWSIREKEKSKKYSLIDAKSWMGILVVVFPLFFLSSFLSVIISILRFTFRFERRANLYFYYFYLFFFLCMVDEIKSEWNWVRFWFAKRNGSCRDELYIFEHFFPLFENYLFREKCFGLARVRNRGVKFHMNRENYSKRLASIPDNRITIEKHLVALYSYGATEPLF